MVKHAGLAIADPTHMAHGNWTMSCVIYGHNIAAIHSRVEFQPGDHTKLLVNGRSEIWIRKAHKEGESI